MMFQKYSKEQESYSSKLKTISSLDLYSMTKENLIKRMQILIHELKVFYKMQQESMNIQKKDYYEQEIAIESLTNNQQILKKQCVALQNEIQTLKKSSYQKEVEINKYTKERQLLKKKINELQIYKSKSISHEQKNKQYQMKIKQLENENKELRKNVLQLKSKILIVQQLSREAEMKAVQFILQKKETRSQQSLKIRDQDEIDKQNSNPNVQKGKQKWSKIQTLSLKEQIRNLKQQLRLSQQGRQTLKLKMQQRQLFYSKMISLNY